MGPRGARVKRRRRRRPVRGVLRRAEGVQTRATPSPPAVPATRVMRWLWAATARRPQRRPRTAFDDGGRAGRCGDLRREREPDCRCFDCGRSVGGSIRRQCCDASVRIVEARHGTLRLDLLPTCAAELRQLMIDSTLYLYLLPDSQRLKRSGVVEQLQARIWAEATVAPAHLSKILAAMLLLPALNAMFELPKPARWRASCTATAT